MDGWLTGEDPQLNGLPTHAITDARKETAEHRKQHVRAQLQSAREIPFKVTSEVFNQLHQTYNPLTFKQAANPSYSSIVAHPIAKVGELIAREWLEDIAQLHPDSVEIGPRINAPLAGIKHSCGMRSARDSVRRNALGDNLHPNFEHGALSAAHCQLGAENCHVGSSTLLACHVYDLTPEVIYQIFEAKGARCMYIAIFMPPAISMKVDHYYPTWGFNIQHKDGTIRMGFNGDEHAYHHEHEAWEWAVVKGGYCGADFGLAVEIMRRVGPLAMLRVTRVDDSGTILNSCFNPHKGYVRVIDIIKGFPMIHKVTNSGFFSGRIRTKCLAALPKLPYQVMPTEVYNSVMQFVQMREDAKFDRQSLTTYLRALMSKIKIGDCTVQVGFQVKGEHYKELLTNLFVHACLERMVVTKSIGAYIRYFSEDVGWFERALMDICPDWLVRDAVSILGRDFTAGIPKHTQALYRLLRERQFNDIYLCNDYVQHDISFEPDQEMNEWIHYVPSDGKCLARSVSIISHGCEDYTEDYDHVLQGIASSVPQKVLSRVHFEDQHASPIISGKTHCKHGVGWKLQPLMIGSEECMIPGLRVYHDMVTKHASVPFNDHLNKAEAKLRYAGTVIKAQFLDKIVRRGDNVSVAVACAEPRGDYGYWSKYGPAACYTTGYPDGPGGNGKRSKFYNMKGRLNLCCDKCVNGIEEGFIYADFGADVGDDELRFMQYKVLTNLLNSGKPFALKMQRFTKLYSEYNVINSKIVPLLDRVNIHRALQTGSEAWVTGPHMPERIKVSRWHAFLGSPVKGAYPPAEQKRKWLFRPIDKGTEIASPAYSTTLDGEYDDYNITRKTVAVLPTPTAPPSPVDWEQHQAQESLGWYYDESSTALDDESVLKSLEEVGSLDHCKTSAGLDPITHEKMTIIEDPSKFLFVQRVPEETPLQRLEVDPDTKQRLAKAYLQAVSSNWYQDGGHVEPKSTVPEPDATSMTSGKVVIIRQPYGPGDRPAWGSGKSSASDQGSVEEFHEEEEEAINLIVSTEPAEVVATHSSWAEEVETQEEISLPYEIDVEAINDLQIRRDPLPADANATKDVDWVRAIYWMARDFYGVKPMIFVGTVQITHGDYPVYFIRKNKKVILLQNPTPLPIRGAPEAIVHETTVGAALAKAMQTQPGVNIQASNLSPVEHLKFARALQHLKRFRGGELGASLPKCDACAASWYISERNNPVDAGKARVIATEEICTKALQELKEHLKAPSGSIYADTHSSAIEQIARIQRGFRLATKEVKGYVGVAGSGKSTTLSKALSGFKNVQFVAPTKVLAKSYRDKGYKCSTPASFIAKSGKSKVGIVALDEVFLLHPGVLVYALAVAKEVYIIGDPRQNLYGSKECVSQYKIDDLVDFSTLPRLNISYTVCPSICAYLAKYYGYEMYTKSALRASVNVMIGEVPDKGVETFCFTNRSEDTHTSWITAAKVQGLRKEETNLYIETNAQPLIDECEGQYIVAMTRSTGRTNIFCPNGTVRERLNLGFFRNEHDCKYGGITQFHNSYWGAQFIDVNLQVTEKEGSKFQVLKFEGKQAQQQVAIGMGGGMHAAFIAKDIDLVPVTIEDIPRPLCDRTGVPLIIEPTGEPLDPDFLGRPTYAEVEEVLNVIAPTDIDMHDAVGPHEHHVFNQPKGTVTLKQEGSREPLGNRGTVTCVKLPLRTRGRHSRNDNTGHVLHTMIERCMTGAALEPAQEEDILDLVLNQVDTVLPKIGEITPDMVSMALAEQIDRVREKGNSDQEQVFDPEIHWLSDQIKCFNKQQVKADVAPYSAIKLGRGGLPKAGQGISAQSKAVNLISGSLVRACEKLLRANLSWEYVYCPGLHPTELAREMRLRAAAGWRTGFECDISQFDNMRGGWSEKVMSHIYERMGANTVGIKIMQLLNKSWTFDAGNVKAAVRNHFQSGRADTLFSNTVVCMLLMRAMYKVTDLTLAAHQGDDVMWLCDSVKWVGPDYMKAFLKTEITPVPSIVGFIFGRRLGLDIGRMAVKLANRPFNLGEKSIQDYQDAVREWFQVVPSDTALYENCVAYAKKKGITMHEAETLAAFLLNFAYASPKSLRKSMIVIRDGARLVFDKHHV